MSKATAQIDPRYELETPPADLSTKKVLGGQIQCVVVTPERAVIDELVGFVALPLYDGELGISPAHTPLVGRLGYGELRIRTATTTRRYFLDGGFVQVRDDVVTVLTNRAIAADKIDVDAAKQDLKRARTRRATTEFEQAERERAIDRARAQLRVAGHKLRVS